MDEPRSTRPHMPGYGVLGPTEGTGLLPWSWAVQRLITSRDYWLATRWPDGRPHLMPVWGVWDDDAWWCSSGSASRKVRNLMEDPRCTLSTDNAWEPVVVEGTASTVTDLAARTRFITLLNTKYATSYPVEFTDPATTATILVRPRWAFGLTEDDFGGSPTSWHLGT